MCNILSRKNSEINQILSLNLWTVLISSSKRSGVLKGSSESFPSSFQARRGGYCSQASSFGAEEVASIMAPSLVLLVMLEIGGACGKDTFLGFLGADIPEILVKEGTGL